MGLRIGQRIGGAFEITDELSGSGTSEKYRAEVISNDVPGWMAQLFVKFYPSDALEKVNLDELYSTLDALAKNSSTGLQHLIQPVYVGLLEHALVLAYPHLKARSLDDFMRVNQSKDAAHRLSIGLVESVKSMHSLGVQHNRIAPSNVLLSRSSQDIERSICFVDIESVTIGGHWLIQRAQNELDYASPEQRDLENCSDVEASSDIYSLGRVLIDLLAGFNGPGKIMLSADSVDHSIRLIATEWGADVSEVLSAALNQTPEMRPGTSELLRVLRGARVDGSENSERRKTERDVSQKYRQPVQRAISDRIEPERAYSEKRAKEDGKARRTYVEIVASRNERFKRRYLADQSLTDRDFTGSGASLPSGKLFELFLVNDSWSLKVTANDLEISVDAKQLMPWETVQLQDEAEIVISGYPFRLKLLDY